MSINNLETQVLALPVEPPLHFYLIVDSAQDSRHPLAIQQAEPGTRSQCLLTLAQGPDLEAAAPHLMTFPQFERDAASWQWVSSYGPTLPAAVSIIASSLQFEALYAHLHSSTEVLLPDGEEMILAFWDPAVLATLVGQLDDTTLHVLGPVLTVQQREKFLTGITAWWYWDRNGKLHQIAPALNPSAANTVMLPLRLSQTQVDMLVEASLPDHIVGYINANKPELLAKIAEPERYPRVEKHLHEARKLRLLGMRDILDYVCAALIYGDGMYESSVIEALLEKVRMRQTSLAEALEQFP
ncbi:hypothetical protein LMG28727_00142 [Paraburkholderia kirstenboschensis]|uniref:DUF4123 domain-containing protein n=1 Tax=Paraburkholderia kirstenboschensis TaxID=1245436 RepID=UPI00191AD4C6|nr:DUF4123 domain-containing protein [Paraburkholderia kirstenboschensis]CAD6508345.1 hypothetical protein LMG28727_00142 [Paraburkholderia kirstenboschensis]